MSGSRRKAHVVAVIGAAGALGGFGGAGVADTAVARPASRSAGARPAARSGLLATPGIGAALTRIHDAIRAQAPVIATPLLDAGVAAGTITATQEHDFLARLSGPPLSIPRPAVADPSPAQRDLFRSVFTAIRAHVPAIAKPLLDDAVAANTITQTQADRIAARLAEGPRRFGIRPLQR